MATSYKAFHYCPEVSSKFDGAIHAAKTYHLYECNHYMVIMKRNAEKEVLKTLC
jgi:hypothetical protein